MTALAILYLVFVATTVFGAGLAHSMGWTRLADILVAFGGLTSMAIGVSLAIVALA